MKTLYIIGNGFDLAHELPTRYGDFHEWLDEHRDIHSQAYEFIDSIDGLTNGVEFWNEFEKALGAIDGEEYFKHIIEEYKETQDEDDWSAQSAAVYAGIEFFKKDNYQDLLDAFGEWACDIEVDEDEVEIKYPQLMNDKEDYFFTFNYTPTLEKIYHIPEENIKHIHGDYTEKTEIVVGHATEYGDLIDKMNKIDDDQLPTDVGDSVNKMIEMLNMSKKDTGRIISENYDYFRNLRELRIKRIVVIGHSYGKVDSPYFSMIKDNCPRAQWEMTHFKGDMIDQAKEMAQELGICAIFPELSLLQSPCYRMLTALRLFFTCLIGK